MASGLLYINVMSIAKRVFWLQIKKSFLIKALPLEKEANVTRPNIRSKKCNEKGLTDFDNKKLGHCLVCGHF
jgi:hypothetical protein